MKISYIFKNTSKKDAVEFLDSNKNEKMPDFGKKERLQNEICKKW